MTDQPERRTFISEEFEAARANEMHRDRPTIVNAALRIAANVMRPGVIEESLEIGLWESSSEAVAAVIRAALTEPQP